MTLMCVGGPKHGERVTVPPGARSWIVALEPVWLAEAMWDSMKALPDTVVPIHQAVYKVEMLRHDMGETSVSMKVLAYYGRDRQDRPEGWYL
jgi:hypothetical protein